MIDLNILENLQENKILENISNFQENFFKSRIGKAINIGINCGIRTICPNLIEEQVIDIKDALLENGISGGIKEICNSIKDFSRSVEGIITGKFESVSQIEFAIKNGGVIDTFSDVLDYAIGKAKENGKLEKDVAKLLIKEKNVLLKDVTKSISEELLSEQKSIEKLERYCNDWKNAFQNKNFKDMEKVYKKIEKQIGNVIPIQNTVIESKKIENIHNLIKNNNGNFDVTKEELELAEKLV